MTRHRRWIPLVACTGLVGACSIGNDPDSTSPRIPTDSLVAIVGAPTTVGSNPSSYTVQQGDNLSSIADRFDVDVGELASVNGITDPDNIFAGQTLVIPGGDSSAGGSSTTTTTGP